MIHNADQSRCIHFVKEKLSLDAGGGLQHKPFCGTETFRAWESIFFSRDMYGRRFKSHVKGLLQGS